MIKALPLELAGVTDAIAYGKGGWRTCSGCHETNEGVPLGPYSNLLKCHLGIGCFECGGIGAVWDVTDYANMGRFLAEDAARKEAENSWIEAKGTYPQGLDPNCFIQIRRLGEPVGVRRAKDWIWDAWCEYTAFVPMAGPKKLQCRILSIEANRITGRSDNYNYGVFDSETIVFTATSSSPEWVKHDASGYHTKNTLDDLYPDGWEIEFDLREPTRVDPGAPVCGNCRFWNGIAFNANRPDHGDWRLCEGYQVPGAGFQPVWEAAGGIATRAEFGCSAFAPRDGGWL